jgi:hypothetical protein
VHDGFRIARFLTGGAPSVASPIIRTNAGNLRKLRLDSPPEQVRRTCCVLQNDGRRSRASAVDVHLGSIYVIEGARHRVASVLPLHDGEVHECRGKQQEDAESRNRCLKSSKNGAFRTGRHGSPQFSVSVNDTAPICFVPMDQPSRRLQGSVRISPSACRLLVSNHRKVPAFLSICEFRNSLVSCPQRRP